VLPDGSASDERQLPDGWAGRPCAGGRLILCRKLMGLRLSERIVQITPVRSPRYGVRRWLSTWKMLRPRFSRIGRLPVDRMVRRTVMIDEPGSRDVRVVVDEQGVLARWADWQARAKQTPISPAAIGHR
jgi:hypothetical protein